MNWIKGRITDVESKVDLMMTHRKHKQTTWIHRGLINWINMLRIVQASLRGLEIIRIVQKCLQQKNWKKKLNKSFKDPIDASIDSLENWKSLSFLKLKTMFKSSNYENPMIISEKIPKILDKLHNNCWRILKNPQFKDKYMKEWKQSR